MIKKASKIFMPSYSRLELVKKMEERMRELKHEFF